MTRYRPPTAADLEAIAAEWATRDGGIEDETTVVVSGYDPDTFTIWSGRGKDVRSVLARAGGRILALEQHPHGIRFTFPRSALKHAGIGALLTSPAKQESMRGRRPGFASALPTSTGADDGSGEGV